MTSQQTEKDNPGSYINPENSCDCLARYLKGLDQTLPACFPTVRYKKVNEATQCLTVTPSVGFPAPVGGPTSSVRAPASGFTFLSPAPCIKNTSKST